MKPYLILHPHVPHGHYKTVSPQELQVSQVGRMCYHYPVPLLFHLNLQVSYLDSIIMHALAVAHAITDHTHTSKSTDWPKQA